MDNPDASPRPRTPPVAGTPPLPGEFGRFPVTSLLIGFSGLLYLFTIVSDLQRNPTNLARELCGMDVRWMLGEPWRLFSSALLHGSPLHLLMNVFWLWMLGTHMEARLGSLRYLALCVVWGVGANAAEYALNGPAIGLSGVVFGLVTWLWVAERFRPDYRDILTPGMAQMTLIWFFFAIVLTLLNLYPIANVAHATGALLGGLGALAQFPSRVPIRALSGLGALALFGACLWGAGPGRPLVNVPDHNADAINLGWKAAMNDDQDSALNYFVIAVAVGPNDPIAHYDLGLTLLEFDRTEEALAHFERALALDPANEKYRQLVEALRPGA